MFYNFLIFSMLCTSSAVATIYYDEDGRPDYDKINEAMEKERQEKEKRSIC